MEIARGSLAAIQIAKLHAIHTMPALGGKPRRMHLHASCLVSNAVCTNITRAGLRGLKLSKDGARFCHFLRRSQDCRACKARQANLGVSAGPDAGPQRGCRPEGRASRRALLADSALVGCLAAACSSPRIAAALGVTPGQAAAALRAANVVPALPPSGYLRLIAASRPTAERTVAAQVPFSLCHVTIILQTPVSCLTALDAA